MQAVSTQNPLVQVALSRVIWFGGEWRQPGDVIEVSYVEARGLESTHKGSIVNRPETDGEAIVVEPVAGRKGKK